jgi:hypothetical protein
MSLLHALAPLFDQQRVPATVSGDTQQRVVPSYDKRELSRFGATNVTENDDSLVFEVDAPGCTSNDFNIEVSKQLCMMMLSSPCKPPHTLLTRAHSVTSCGWPHHFNPIPGWQCRGTST